MISLTDITGAAQTGFTSPTAEVAVDQAPDVNAKQWYIDAIGGTGFTASIHSASKPFTISFWRDKIIKILPQLLLNGRLPAVPVNRYKVITRKGVLPQAGQPASVMIVRTELEVPAGSELYNPDEVRIAISAHIGALAQQSAGLGDSVVSASL